VYIHGGAFTSGSGALPLYDGTSLASQGDIVVVTINYRLGVFGFLADDALGGSTAGHQGILDQLAALHWVQDNIRAFGGDPDHVTVAGESAGSGSACIMGASPLAAGLVHGIIGESGGCLGSVGNRETGDLYDDASTAREVAQELSRALGGATLDEMRKMPAERVAEAASELTVHWFPTIDGLVESSLNLVSGVDSDPSRYRQEAREAYGSDAPRFLQLYPGDDEESVTASRIASETHKGMTAPMRKWALTATETGTSNVYSYSFSRTPPVPGLERFGAYHGAEVAYAYGNLGADGTPASDDVDRRLEAEMSAYWIAFVRSGDPNGADRIHWPVLGDDPERLLVFGDTTAIAPRPFAEEVDFWLDR
jgi:para-nitrobenzyl esterase